MIPPKSGLLRGVVALAFAGLGACSAAQTPVVGAGNPSGSTPSNTSARSGTTAAGGGTTGTGTGVVPGTSIAGGETTLPGPSDAITVPGGVTITSVAAGAATSTSPPTTGAGSPTTAAVTTPTTAAVTTTSLAKPTLTATGPAGDATVHCMGGVTSVQASATWSTTNATQVAVALGQVTDAFSAPPYNPNLFVTSGSYPVPLSCSGPAQQYTTVTASGPGGKTTAVITWTVHHM